jgi:hypothetical protein
MNVSILIHFLGAQRLQRRFTNKRSKYATTNQDTTHTKIPGTGACFIAGGWPMKPLMSYGPHYSVTPHGVPSFCCLPLSGPSSAGGVGPSASTASSVGTASLPSHSANQTLRFPQLRMDGPTMDPKRAGVSNHDATEGGRPNTNILETKPSNRLLLSLFLDSFLFS